MNTKYVQVTKNKIEICQTRIEYSCSTISDKPKYINNQRSLRVLTLIFRKYFCEEMGSVKQNNVKRGKYVLAHS